MNKRHDAMLVYSHSTRTGRLGLHAMKQPANKREYIRRVIKYVIWMKKELRQKKTSWTVPMYSLEADAQTSYSNL